MGYSNQEQLPLVSIVIPAHNEAENLVPLLNEIQATLVEFPPYEVIVVDDGSTDGTDLQFMASQVLLPRLQWLQHSRRAGKSLALLTGVRAARGKWVITLDGDGQNAPSDILKLWETRGKAETTLGPGVVVVGQRGERHESLAKIYASRLANKIRAAVLGDQTPDSACGLKVFVRQDFLALPQFDNMHRFLPALFQCLGREVISVSVENRPRRFGTSHYGLWDRFLVGIVDLFGVWWLKRRWLKTENVEGSLKTSGLEGNKQP